MNGNNRCKIFKTLGEMHAFKTVSQYGAGNANAVYTETIDDITEADDENTVEDGVGNTRS